MATIGTASHSSYLNTPRRAYITTTTFQNDIFQYTTTTNPSTFEVTGTLTSLATVGTGTAATCPANRILVENGKKLYPSGLAISNNTTYGAPNPGVTTYMVGVYDPGSFLSGFIDPNSQVFAPYNTDKPNYVPRGVNPNGTTIDQGPPVYTLGSVTAGTTITAGTGLTVTTGGLVVNEGMLRNADTVTLTTITGSGAQTAQTITPTAGMLHLFTTSASGAASITLNGPADLTGTTGAYVVLRILATTVQNTTITFGTNTFDVGNLIVTAAAGPITQAYVVTFISDGSRLYEVSRTAAQVV
jgi:hypothetical protein